MKKEEKSASSADVPKRHKDLKEKLQRCEKERADYLAGWQRTKADYLNSKKNEIERIKEIVRGVNADLILKILPILDNLELSEKNLSEDLQKNDFVKGIIQIRKQFQDILKQEGVEEIRAKGEKFDPNFHEVIGEIEKKDVSSGTIIEEIQKGYTINGRLLRPAKIKVSK